MYKADGIFYNKNELGNFMWSDYLSSLHLIGNGYPKIFLKGVAQAGAIGKDIKDKVDWDAVAKFELTSLKEINNIRTDEWWDQKALNEGYRYSLETNFQAFVDVVFVP